MPEEAAETGSVYRKERGRGLQTRDEIMVCGGQGKQRFRRAERKSDRGQRDQRLRGRNGVHLQQGLYLRGGVHLPEPQNLHLQQSLYLPEPSNLYLQQGLFLPDLQGLLLQQPDPLHL